MTRIEFICGGRALRDLRKKGALLGRIAGSLTVGLDEVEDAVRRVREQEEASRKRLATVMVTLLTYQAHDLLARAGQARATPVVHLVRDDLSLDEARTLAHAVTGGGGLIVLGIKGEKAQLLVGRPADHSLDCGKLVREVLTAFGGRGGGQPAMAQGGIPDPNRLADAVAEAVSKIKEQA
jgi:alanyl-tRNA synthetase